MGNERNRSVAFDAVRADAERNLLLLKRWCSRNRLHPIVKPAVKA